MPQKSLNTVSEIIFNSQGIISCNDRNQLIARGNTTPLETECNTKGIKFDKDTEGITLKLKGFITGEIIFFDHLSKYFDPTFLNDTFSIISSTSEYCFHLSNTEELVFSDNATPDFKVQCSNIYYYYRFYTFLLTDNFSDHHNGANREIIIYSGIKGILKIKYAPQPNIDSGKDYKEEIKKLIGIASVLEFQKFFKNALFTYADALGNIQLTDVIYKGKDIAEITKRDHELVSKRFNFEKIRNALYKEKERYFGEIRTVVDKVFSQAIGIPISISASVFAADKAKEDLFVLLLILFAFIIYVFVYLRIQSSYKRDMEELRTTFNIEFAIIKSSSGLDNAVIEPERIKIDRKINTTISMIKFLMWVIVSLGLLLISYIIYEFVTSETTRIIKELINIPFEAQLF